MFDDVDDLIPISGLFFDDDGPHIIVEEEYLVPIAQLFFDDDGPHIVATAPAPARYTPARGLEAGARRRCGKDEAILASWSSRWRQIAWVL